MENKEFYLAVRYTVQNSQNIENVEDYIYKELINDLKALIREGKEQEIKDMFTIISGINSEEED